MNPGDIVIVGAAETDLGALPTMSELDLRAEAAHLALADAGLKLADVDGVTSAVESPVDIAHYLGIEPAWYDGTSIGGCSALVHVRHAAAAIAAGQCSTVLVLHGESGRSRVGKPLRAPGPQSMFAQFELPFGVSGPFTLFTLPALRFMHETGTTHEQLAAVPAVQSRWATGNPRASRNVTRTVQDVLDSPLVAYPFHKLECCVVTDGGGALVLTSRDQAEARGTTKQPVYLLGAGEATGVPLVSSMGDASTFAAFRNASAAAFNAADVTRGDVDHLMVYDAFAHVPLYGLQDMGFVKPGEAGAFVEDGNTAPGGVLPMNTNGGGLCYTHTGMYGMFAIQEAIRQLRGEAHQQLSDVEVSAVQGVGGMFAAAATLILSNRLA